MNTRQKSAVLRAQKAAVARKHLLSDFQANGKLQIAKCEKCLCLAIIHPTGQVEGVVVNYDCHTEVDRRSEFTYEPMSREHEERISGYWRHPSKPAK